MRLFSFLNRFVHEYLAYKNPVHNKLCVQELGAQQTLCARTRCTTSPCNGITTAQASLPPPQGPLPSADHLPRINASRNTTSPRARARFSPSPAGGRGGQGVRVVTAQPQAQQRLKSPPNPLAKAAVARTFPSPPAPLPDPGRGEQNNKTPRAPLARDTVPGYAGEGSKTVKPCAVTR